MKNQQIRTNLKSTQKLFSLILILFILGFSDDLSSKADPYYPSYNPNYYGSSYQMNSQQNLNNADYYPYNPNYYGNPYQMNSQQNPNNAYGYTATSQAVPGGMVPNTAYTMQAMPYNPMMRNLPGVTGPNPQSMAGMQMRELKPNQQVVDILGARVEDGSKMSNSSIGTSPRGFWKRN